MRAREREGGCGNSLALELGGGVSAGEWLQSQEVERDWNCWGFQGLEDSPRPGPHSLGCTAR